MNGLAITDYKAAYTNDLIDKINDYDLAKVQAQADGVQGMTEAANQQRAPHAVVTGTSSGIGARHRASGSSRPAGR